MHRTSARPVPLDFRLPPTHSAKYETDPQNIVGLLRSLPHISPGYLEAPTRDGLRTPPADIMEMGTKYQHPIHNGYGGRQELGYLAPTTSANNYSGTYSGIHSGTRQYSVSGQPQASALRNEIQQSQHPYNQPASPQTNSTNPTIAPEASQPRKGASSDVIVPNLQIPSSVNNSGGSLAEFAAQVNMRGHQVEERHN